MSKIMLFAGFLIVSGSALLVGQSLGSLQGVVTDSQGSPLAGAQVQYHRMFLTVAGDHGQSVLAPGETVFGGAVSAGAGGAFAAASLPVGNYLLCASVPGVPYLDPCQWAAPVVVTVSANTTSTRNIALAKGVYLNVQVNDPLGLVPAAQPVGQGSKFLVGINFSNGAYIGLPNTQAAGSVHNYRNPIPTGVPLSLWLFSTDLSLTDANGNAVNLSTGFLAPFQASVGADQAFTFTVSGAAASSPNRADPRR